MKYMYIKLRKVFVHTSLNHPVFDRQTDRQTNLFTRIVETKNVKRNTVNILIRQSKLRETDVVFSVSWETSSLFVSALCSDRCELKNVRCFVGLI